jgi:hypothetical protein
MAVLSPLLVGAMKATVCWVSLVREKMGFPGPADVMGRKSSGVVSRFA